MLVAFAICLSASSSAVSAIQQAADSQALVGPQTDSDAATPQSTAANEATASQGSLVAPGLSRFGSKFGTPPAQDIVGRSGTSGNSESAPAIGARDPLAAATIASTPQESNDVIRVEAIHRRIDLLEKLIDEKRNRALASQPPAAQANDTASGESTAEAQEISDSAKTSNGEDPGQSETTADPIPGAGETLGGQQVTPVPVDSGELANSLFLTGNYNAARKSYEARLAKEQDEQEIAWLKCMIGNCFRLEKDFTSAEKLLREVANIPKQNYATDFSRWAIEYGQQRRMLGEEFAILSNEIDELVGNPEE